MTTSTVTPIKTTGPVCGKSYTRKVKGGATNTYKCEKPKGHDSDPKLKSPHGRVYVKKEVSVPAGALASFEMVPETEYVPLVARERSEEQQTVDAHVKKAHGDWIAAGKPTTPQTSPRSRYIIPAEHVEGVKTMLRRAGDFHNVRVQIAPPVQHESGNISIQFRVTDRTEKDEKTKPSEIRNPE